MNLGTVKARLGASHYKTIEELKADVATTFRNYIEHNEPSTDIAKLAHRFEALMQRLFRTWLVVRNIPLDKLDDDICHVCHSDDDPEDNPLLECEGCDVLCHEGCLQTPVERNAGEQWICGDCTVSPSYSQLFHPTVPLSDAPSPQPQVAPASAKPIGQTLEPAFISAGAGTPSKLRVEHLDLDEHTWSDSPTHVATHHSWRDPPEHSFSDWTIVAVSSTVDVAAAVAGSTSESATMPTVLTNDADLMSIYVSARRKSYLFEFARLVFWRT
eukprot:SAG11_NODE_54_length_19571_cov_29.437786_22_plen_271_part_00